MDIVISTFGVLNVFVVGVCPMHCRMLDSISGLSLLNASSTFSGQPKTSQTFTGVSWWRWRNYWGLRIIGSNHVSLAQTIRVVSEVFRGRDWEKDWGGKGKVLQLKKSSGGVP